MKTVFYFLILMILISCNSTKESEGEQKYFPSKDKFILSEYHRYLDEKNNLFLDSLRKTDEGLVLDTDPHPIYGSFDKFGFTHLIVLSNDEIYFHQEKTNRNMRTGHFDCVITKDLI